MKILITVLVVVVVGLSLGGVLNAQNTVRGQTIFNKVFEDLEVAPTTSDNVQNIGQSSHVVAVRFQDNPPNVCAAPNAEIEFQRSYDNVFFFPEWGKGDTDFFQTDDDGNIYMYNYYSGSFPFIRFRVTAFDTANCMIDMWYSGTTLNDGNVRTQVGEGKPGLDSVTDAIIDLFGESGITRPLRNAPLGFNGVTWDRMLACNTTAVIDIAAASTTEVIALAAGDSIHVCSVNLSMAAAGTVQLIEGTGADCVTAPTDLTGAFSLGASFPLIMGGNVGRLLVGTASEALCITTIGGGATAEGLITYAQY